MADHNVCSICTHPHRAALDARLIAKRPDGTSQHSAASVVSWMVKETILPPVHPRALNRHRKNHLNVPQEVAKRRAAEIEARARGETLPLVDLPPEMAEAVHAEVANLDMLDRWASRIGQMGDYIIAKATKPGDDGKPPPPPSPQEVIFLVQGARAAAALATAQNAILTGTHAGRGILGANPDKKGLKEFIQSFGPKPPPIAGDRPDGAPPTTRDDIERALSDLSEGDRAADAYGTEDEPDAEDDDTPADGPTSPGTPPPDSGPTMVVQGSAEDVPPIEAMAVPYSYKPPPAATRPLPLRLVGGASK